jgi:hypothetical protein
MAYILYSIIVVTLALVTGSSCLPLSSRAQTNISPSQLSS